MLAPGDRVLVGLSGGLDSVVLLYVLQHLRERFDIHLASAHLNHQFRGAEARRDADFAARYSESLGIRCYVGVKDVPQLIQQHKWSPEEAARQARYQFFDEIAHRVQARKIATGHTADDQAETVLIGLLRGAGLHGMGGIRPMLNHRIIRPLLTTTRDQIAAFARTEELEYVEDSSNADRQYMRNAVRLDLIPLLKQQLNPAIVNRLTTYAQLCREDAFFIDKMASEHYYHICEQRPGKIQIKLDLFAKEYIPIQRALLYQMYATLTGSSKGLETQHAQAVIALWTRGETGKRLSLPHGVIARRSYEVGYLEHPPGASEQAAGPAPVELPCPGRVHFDVFCIETHVRKIAPEMTDDPALLPTRTPEGAMIQWMDYSCIHPPLRVRYRRAGDRFRPLGVHGTQRLKKIFIDRKIPRDRRDKIPVLEDDDGICWVVGQMIDERVKITSTTRTVLVCQVSQTTNRLD